MNVEQLIREYLQAGKTRMMQVATSINNQPWICTVYYAVDEQLNLYWLSKPTRRHSQELTGNPKVAAAIVYDQQPPQPHVRGIQVQGTATLLEGDAAIQAIHLYADQLNSDPEWIAKVLSGQDPHRPYRLKPEKIALFDSLNFPNESPQEWSPNA